MIGSIIYQHIHATPEFQSLAHDLGRHLSITQIGFNPFPFAGQVPKSLLDLFRGLSQIRVKNLGAFAGKSMRAAKADS